MGCLEAEAGFFCGRAWNLSFERGVWVGYFCFRTKGGENHEDD